MKTTTIYPTVYLIDSDCAEDWQDTRSSWFQWKLIYSDESIQRISIPSSLEEAISLIKHYHSLRLPVKIVCQSAASPIISFFFNNEVDGIDIKKLLILNLEVTSKIDALFELREPDKVILEIWSQLCVRKIKSDERLKITDFDLDNSYSIALNKWINKIPPIEREQLMPERVFHRDEFISGNLEVSNPDIYQFVHRQFPLVSFRLCRQGDKWDTVPEGIYFTMPEIILNDHLKYSVDSSATKKQAFWKKWLESFNFLSKKESSNNWVMSLNEQYRSFNENVKYFFSPEMALEGKSTDIEAKRGVLDFNIKKINSVKEKRRRLSYSMEKIEDTFSMKFSCNIENDKASEKIIIIFPDRHREEVELKPSGTILFGMLEIRVDEVFLDNSKDWVILWDEQAQFTSAESTKPALSNVIKLDPPCKLLTPRTVLAMAASSGDEERKSGGGKTYAIQTLSNHEVTVVFEFRTNPMTQRVTTKLRLSIPQALTVDITIAWLPPQTEDDAMISPILQCQLKAGNTEAVVTRVFEPNEWESLPVAPEFGEVGDTED